MRMNRPRRLDAEFVRKVNYPGRFGDGRGGFGLSLLVQLSGRGIIKSWTQRIVQRNGRPTSIGLGSYLSVSLADAREAAARNALAVKAGEDVLSDRQRRDPAMLTFQQAAERAIQSYAQGWQNDKTSQVWRSMLASYVYPRIGNLPLNEVSGADLFATIQPVWTTHRATATKVRTAINAIYAWAIANDIATTNPLHNVKGALLKVGGQVTHRKALAWADVPAMLATIRDSGAAETTKLAVEFLALTAARSGEVRGAEWGEIDGGVWTVPASRMKQGKPHRVPLSTAALAVLAKARALTGGHGLVFPSRTGRPLSDGTLSKLFKDLGIDCVPHGLRSSFRVWAAEADVPREVAEFALAHVVGSAAERSYQRSDLFRQRVEVMQTWGDVLTVPEPTA